MEIKLYLKIDGIPGDSTERGYEEWIEAHQRSFSIKIPTDPSHGAGSGRAQFSDIKISKFADKSSIKLALACASVKAIANIIIAHTRPDSGTGTRKQYMVYTLKNCRITSWAPSCTTENQLGDVEEVTLSYETIEYTYYPTTGNNSEKAGWDISKNIETTAQTNVKSNPLDQIRQAKDLLDSNAITEKQFEKIRETFISEIK